jgi:hypothetical protein
MVRFALRWILMSEAVTCAIPSQMMAQIGEIYQRRIKPQVHHLW